MSECRHVKQNSKKLGQIIYDGVFSNFRSEFIKLLLLIPILVSMAMIVWLDRRVWGLVQKEKDLFVGPFELFQTLADALKYIFKEIIIPASANKVVSFLLQL